MARLEQDPGNGRSTPRTPIHTRHIRARENPAGTRDLGSRRDREMRMGSTLGYLDDRTSDSDGLLLARQDPGEIC